MSDKPAVAHPTVPGTRWKRWEMSAFDIKPDHHPSERAPSKRAEDIAARIKQAQDAVREQARTQGYEAGHAQGLRAGFDTGKQSGHQEGYKAGHAEGYPAGHAEGIRQASVETDRLSNLATQCARAIEDIEADVGQALLALSIRIAEHVMQSTLDAHPEIIIDMVRQVLHIKIGRAHV